MQIHWNYQSNYKLFRLIQLCLSWIATTTGLLLLLFSFTGCTPLSKPQGEPDRAVSSILSVPDQANLPEVIKSLLVHSDTQYYNHNLTGALATLERALRINPRYAEVWSRMAQIYLDQGDLEQAKQHAKRSNSVIKNNTQFRAFNNKIIKSPALSKPIERSKNNAPVAF